MMDNNKQTAKSAEQIEKNKALEEAKAKKLKELDENVKKALIPVKQITEAQYSNVCRLHEESTQQGIKYTFSLNGAAAVALISVCPLFYKDCPTLAYLFAQSAFLFAIGTFLSVLYIILDMISLIYLKKMFSDVKKNIDAMCKDSTKKISILHRYKIYWQFYYSKFESFILKELSVLQLLCLLGSIFLFGLGIYKISQPIMNNQQQNLCAEQGFTTTKQNKNSKNSSLNKSKFQKSKISLTKPN